MLEYVDKHINKRNRIIHSLLLFSHFFIHSFFFRLFLHLIPLFLHSFILFSYPFIHLFYLLNSSFIYFVNSFCSLISSIIDFVPLFLIHSFYSLIPSIFHVFLNSFDILRFCSLIIFHLFNLFRHTHSSICLITILFLTSFLIFFFHSSI